ncbi:MAG TPA: hypothetical protein VK879_01520 [Candidatus Sulfomarinibacteraceae bacterium]|nr:hypothetical protein [Candidatus Sulfomarinibacteraceae bacterium]
MSSNERTFTVYLRNDGNVPHDYRVRGYDPTGDLSFRGNSGPYALQPGEEASVPLTVRVERRPLIGVSTFYPFETRVEQVDNGAVHSNTGQLRVTPLIPAWLFLLLPLLFACGALLLVRFPIITPGPTATQTPTALVGGTATGTATSTSTATTGAGTATATPTAATTTTGTPTASATTTATGTATGTSTATATVTPTGTATPTPTPATGPTEVPGYPPLTFSVSVNWRLDPANELYAIADVVVSAQGGDGNYTYFRDDILQAGPIFSYYWRRCSNNPVSFRVDSGDGQSVRAERAEFAPCTP